MIRAWLARDVFAALLLAFSFPLIAQQAGSTQVVGGGGGNSFVDSQPSPGARVTEVRIRAAERVDSVQMIYLLPYGRMMEGLRHGGSGGREQVYQLEADEYIVGLSGRCGDGIDSLRIHTNKRVSQFFGGRGGGREFNLNVPAGSQAVGFAGRAGESVDAIGLTYSSVNLPPARRESYSPPGWDTRRQEGSTLIAGGGGGALFTDNPPAEGAVISEIRVWAGDRVDAIQAVYLLPDGRAIEGPRHGGSGGRSARFRLDRDEYLIGVSGRYGEGIDSVRFHTNRRASELFGGRGGDRDYRIDVPANQQAVALTGRAGEFLDAIGLVSAPAARTRLLPGRSRRPY